MMMKSADGNFGPRTPPRVSVIMNCLNGEKYLREAIDSVYAQTVQDFEIVFFDNASTDSSARIANSYDHRMRYMRAPATVSLGEARNLAIAAACGEYLAILDCDDIWLPQKLEKQVPFFSDAAVALVFSDVLLFNDDGYAAPKYGKTPPPQGNVFDRMVVFDNFLCMSTVVIRSAVIKEHHHWFDPVLSGVEDTDLFVRLCRHWQFAYAPHVLCKYRMHQNSVSYSYPQLFLEEQELVLEKYGRLFPEFNAKYSDAFRSRLTRDRAVLEWKNGNSSEARRLIRPLIFKDRSYALVFCAMALPYSVVHRIRALVSSSAYANYA
jgi:glycosyltransferase involved in cell wall biosynthesis